MGSFPSGVAFNDLEIYNDFLIISLPTAGRVKLEDAKYLGSIAEGMGLSGVSLSIGDFCTFIPTRAYRQFRAGEITWREYMGRWSF